MGFPRVFISSTCYDLGEVRDSLVGFLQGLYFEPILSDKGDIFYHPDLHTHESCITEVENCQLFILIIGGRYGGEYKIDTTKSVTNAEYLAAKKLNRPVFTFIKRDVFDDHKLYQRNKNKKNVMKEIEFPSIEKQDYATQIFEFINEVRLSDANNGFFPFEYARDIKELLGKQISGMLYDFLSKRLREKEQIKINQLLDNLTLVNKKTEEIIENIYKKVNKSDADKKIKDIDNVLEASKLFKDIFRRFSVNAFKNKSIEEISQISPKKLSLIDFLISTGDWELKKGITLSKENKKVDILFHSLTFGIPVGGDLSEKNLKEISEWENLFEIYKNLEPTQRVKVLKNIEEL